MKKTAVGVIAVVALTGCGDGGNEVGTAEPSTPPAGSSTPVTPTTTAAVPRQSPVSPASAALPSLNVDPCGLLSLTQAQSFFLFAEKVDNISDGTGPFRVCNYADPDGGGLVQLSTGPTLRYQARLDAYSKTPPAGVKVTLTPVADLGDKATLVIVEQPGAPGPETTVLWVSGGTYFDLVVQEQKPGSLRGPQDEQDDDAVVVATAVQRQAEAVSEAGD